MDSELPAHLTVPKEKQTLVQLSNSVPRGPTTVCPPCSARTGQLFSFNFVDVIQSLLMSAPTEPCGLCMKTAVLQRSHLLPASGYRLVRGRPDEAISSPILITPKKSFTSDKQITDYFLCRECEQMFSIKGESYVMRQCVRNGKFRLRDLLLTTSPVGNWDTGKLFELSSLLGGKTEQYIYFGASIFWRAATHTWKGGGET